MRLLNLGCGSVRPKAQEWTNLDELRAQLSEGTPERRNLDSEENYIDFKIGSGPLPFTDNLFHGILASHLIEHFDCMEGVAIMKDCYRILKPGGVLVVSVPDASYFRWVNDSDTIENAEFLFGEPIHLPDGETTFFDYALWMRQHKAILTGDSLWCYFRKSGFSDIYEISREWLRFEYSREKETDAFHEIEPLLNRVKFSLIMQGTK